MDINNFMYIKQYNEGINRYTEGDVSTWRETLPDHLRLGVVADMIVDHLQFKEDNSWVFVNDKIAIIKEFWEAVHASDVKIKDISDWYADLLQWIGPNVQVYDENQKFLMEIGDLFDKYSPGHYIIGYRGNGTPIFKDVRFYDFTKRSQKFEYEMYTGVKPKVSDQLKLVKDVEKLGVNPEEFGKIIGDYDSHEFNASLLFSKYVKEGDVKLLPENYCCLGFAYEVEPANQTLLDKRKSALVDYFSGDCEIPDIDLVENEAKWNLKINGMEDYRYLFVSWNFVPQAVTASNDRAAGIFDTTTMEFIVPSICWAGESNPQLTAYFSWIEGTIIEFLYFFLLRKRMVGFSIKNDQTDLRTKIKSFSK